MNKFKNKIYQNYRLAKINKISEFSKIYFSEYYQAVLTTKFVLISASPWTCKGATGFTPALIPTRSVDASTYSVSEPVIDPWILSVLEPVIDPLTSSCPSASWAAPWPCWGRILASTRTSEDRRRQEWFIREKV